MCLGLLSLPPHPLTHRQRVLVMLISPSVAPSPSTSVLIDILSMNFFSHGQVEPMAT